MADELRYRATLEDKVTGPLLRIGKGFDKAVGKGSSASFFGNVGAKAFATGMGLIEHATGAATDFIFDSIKASSDLTEQINKAAVVFGPAADKVEAFGDRSAAALGLSKRAAIEAAGTFGNLFTGVGKSQAVAADMSTTLVRLASDLASFNNLDPSDVLEKLRSGLAGEAEPLRAVGVFLTEAKVKAKAMELGLADANGEVSEGAKITARYQLILEETTQSQGDFARTSGSMANQQRTLNAELEDTQATLGEKLIPVVIEAQRGLIGFLSTVDVFIDQQPKTRSEVEKTQQAIYDFGRSLPFVGDAWKTAADVIVPQAKSIGVVTGKMRDDFYQATSDVSDYSSAMAKGIGTDSDKVQAAWDKMVSSLKSDVSDLIDKVYDPTIERDHLAANKAEETSLRKILASSKSSRAEKQDARDRLHELAKDDTEYYLKLLESGDITKTEYSKLMASLEKKSKTSTGKAKADVDTLIARAKELYRVLIAGPSINITLEVHKAYKDRGKAAGGPVYKGRAYTVGEEGEETFVPQENGYIVPHGASMAGGRSAWMGGGVTVNFNSIWPPTREQARAIAGVVDERFYYLLQQSAPSALRA